MVAEDVFATGMESPSTSCFTSMLQASVGDDDVVSVVGVVDEDGVDEGGNMDCLPYANWGTLSGVGKKR